MADLAAKLETLRPNARALTRMNGIVELGPPLAVTAAVAGDLKAIEDARGYARTLQKPLLPGRTHSAPGASGIQARNCLRKPCRA